MYVDILIFIVWNFLGSKEYHCISTVHQMWNSGTGLSKKNSHGNSCTKFVQFKKENI